MNQFLLGCNRGHGWLALPQSDPDCHSSEQPHFRQIQKCCRSKLPSPAPGSAARRPELPARAIGACSIGREGVVAFSRHKCPNLLEFDLPQKNLLLGTVTRLALLPTLWAPGRSCSAAFCRPLHLATSHPAQPNSLLWLQQPGFTMLSCPVPNGVVQGFGEVEARAQTWKGLHLRGAWTRRGACSLDPT